MTIDDTRKKFYIIPDFYCDYNSLTLSKYFSTKKENNMSLNDFFKFLENKSIQDYIVKLRYKYFHETDWHYGNEILEWDPDLEVYEWRNDWDEGYDVVDVLGYIAIADVDVPDNLKEE